MLRRRAQWVAVCEGEEEQTVVDRVGEAAVSGRSCAVHCWRQRVAWVCCWRIAEDEGGGLAAVYVRREKEKRERGRDGITFLFLFLWVFHNEPRTDPFN